jgi:hypothetical protein
MEKAASATLRPKIDPSADAEIDEIADRIMLELETASSKNLSDAKYARVILSLADVNYTKSVLKQLDSVQSGAERNIEKRAVIRVLLLSIWLQRLYFIIRSFIMGQIGLVLTFTVVAYYGSINLVTSAGLGVVVFVASLVITRLFDSQISMATKRVVAALGSHKTVRDFIMNHL